ncbi:hypothetical protein VTK26DRAFT_5986 [Humicola hyalothermophila]
MGFCGRKAVTFSTVHFRLILPNAPETSTASLVDIFVSTTRVRDPAFAKANLLHPKGLYIRQLYPFVPILTRTGHSSTQVGNIWNQPQPAPFKMATLGTRGNSVAEASSSMNNNQTANHGDNHFESFTDSDDLDGVDGGVRLSDFEEDEYKGLSARANTPPAYGSVYGLEKTSAVGPAGMTASSARRNTIAPIGTGRPMQSTGTVNAAGSANALVDASLMGKGAENQAQERPATHGVTTGFGQSNAHSGHPANTVRNVYAQMTPSHGMRYQYVPGATAQTNTSTPAYRLGHAAYPGAAGANMDHSYGTAPAAYNLPANGHGAQQQPGVLGPSQGPIFSANYHRLNPNATPMNMPKRDAAYQTTTPFGTSLPYNQTEPRNFAPRANVVPHPLPPPAFNLGRAPLLGNGYNGYVSQTTASDSDPFSSTSSPERTMGSHSSRALALAAVPEDDQFALFPPTTFYGPVPDEIRAVRSEKLNRLTAGPAGVPTQDVALDPENFPFIESTTQTGPVSYGVVKIRNIPFATKRSEIIAFLGRNSRILNDCQEPVHIIMERVTSKTQDVYVEFLTMHDAMKAVERHQQNIQKGRQARLGDRPVEVTLSSQSALMKDLFPLASGVFWDGAKPMIQEPVEGQPWKTFKGFVTEEEMTMLVKHVEIPSRSPYSKECPQRPYECMISTLKKLPWYMAEHITLRQRHAVYNATIGLLTLLIQALQRENRMHETVINGQLLKRLATAAMLCPGFSVVQKDNIAVVASMEESRIRMFNQPRFADLWTHLHALCPKPGTPLDVLEWYIAIIREDTTRLIHSKPITERCEIQAIGSYTQLYFGYMWYEMALPTGKELDNLTLRQLARLELAVVERALRRAFPPKH